MPKTSKVKKSKKPKRAGRGVYRASATLTFLEVVNALASPGPDRRSPAEALATFGFPSKLDAARRDFDAAQLQCVKACLAYATNTWLGSDSKTPCADAGEQMIEAASALLRARLEHAPIPVKLTPKGEAAKLKSKAPENTRAQRDRARNRDVAAERRGPK